MILSSKKSTYFNAALATGVYQIGTTSDFTYPQITGIFRLEMEFYVDPTISITDDRFLAHTCTRVTSQRGFILRAKSTTALKFTIAKGSSPYMIELDDIPIVNDNKWKKIVITGDGITCNVYINGILVKTGTFVAKASVGSTSSNRLKIGAFGAGDAGSATWNWKGGIRNFKLFQSTDETKPHIFLPLQDSGNIGAELYQGFNGTYNSTSTIINEEDKKININSKKSTKWIPSSASYLNGIGTSSSMNFIHLTGVFRIEIETKLNLSADFTQARYFLANILVNNGHRGIVLRYSSTTNFVVTMGNGSGTYMVNYNVPITASSNWRKIVVVGDGTKVDAYVDGVYVTGAAITALASSGNANYSLKVGAYASSVTDSTRCFDGNIRNIKIYQSSDTSKPYVYVPMMESSNIGSELWSGLNVVGVGSNLYVEEEDKKINI